MAGAALGGGAGTALGHQVHGTILQAITVCEAHGGVADHDAPGAYLCVNPTGTQFTSADLGAARGYCVGQLAGTFGTLASATTESGVTGPGYYCESAILG